MLPPMVVQAGYEFHIYTIHYINRYIIYTIVAYLPPVSQLFQTQWESLGSQTLVFRCQGLYFSTYLQLIIDCKEGDETTSYRRCCVHEPDNSKSFCRVADLWFLAQMTFSLRALTKSVCGLSRVSSPFLSSPDSACLGMKDLGGCGLIPAPTVSPSFPVSEVPSASHGAMSKMSQEDALSSRCCRQHQHEALKSSWPNDEKENPSSL